MTASEIFVLDNYDSFTSNLVQYWGSWRAELLARRDDEITVEEIAESRPDGIVISPGPGVPAKVGSAYRSCPGSPPAPPP